MENVETMNEVHERKGITGSTIKLIAIIAMLIDHTAAIILERILLNNTINYTPETEAAMALMQQNTVLYAVYGILRMIGRLGFPLFCFLLIQGFIYTRDVKKYAGRLLLFALISEIPFDLGFKGEFFSWGYQNVFFTLFIGLLVMIGFRFIEEKIELHKFFRAAAYVLILIAGMGIAQLMHTDYSAFGVLTIAVMYIFRYRKTLSAVLGCVTLTAMTFMEITAFFAVIPIHKYNGQRGWNIKWLFYAFYPVHILLLYIIACALGISNLPFSL